MKKTSLILLIPFLFGFLSGISFDTMAQCPSLIINGDFEDNSCPSISFKSTLRCNSLFPGTYNIGVNAYSYNYGWHGLDHTNPGTGKFFIGDGPSSVATDDKVWYQTIRVVANTVYTFSAWASNVDVTDYTPDPVLNLSIGGTIIATSGPISENSPWKQMSNTWTAPADMTVEVAIVIKGGNYGGNDFGVDDISFTASFPPVPPPVAPDLSRCGPGSLTLQASNATYYKWYESETGVFAITYGSTLSIPSLTTTQSYYVSAMNAAGCESPRVKVNAIINPVPAPDLGKDTSICAGTSYNFDAGSGYQKYFWNNILSDSIHQFHKAQITGKYWVTVVNQYGCEKTDTARILNVYPLPVADAGSDTAICAGDSLKLSATGGYQYQWMPGGEMVPAITVHPLLTTIYSVTVKDIHSCGTSTDTVLVQVHALPVANAGKDINLCMGDSVKLSEVGDGFLYTWMNDGMPISDITINPTVTTKYSLIVKDAYGCGTSTDEVNVYVHSLPTRPPFDVDSIIHCFDTEKLVLTPVWGNSFYWGSGDTSRSITVDQPGLYTLTVFDSVGCKMTDHIVIYGRCYPQLYVPQAFSPNQDGANDLVEIFGNSFKNFKLMIFNRWGEVIFVSNDRNNQWDGTYRGEEMPVGTYPWIINYQSIFEEDEGKTIKGSITLIR